MKPGKEVFVRLAKANAPEFVSGILKWWLSRNTTREIHDFLAGNGHIWDLIPLQYRNVILEMKPISVDWLTLEWFLNTLNKHRPEVALMVASSPRLLQRLKEEIQLLRVQIGKGESDAYRNRPQEQFKV